MGNRSGKRLSNEERRSRQKERKKIGEKRRRNKVRITTPPIQRGYVEIYNVIRKHIVDFLKSKRQHEKWDTIYDKTQHYKCVTVMIGNKTMFVVDRITFKDDSVTIQVNVLGILEASGLPKGDWHVLVGGRSSHRMINRCEYSKVVGDPNLIDGLDVFLVECYEKYKSHEYSDSINS